MTGLLLTVVDDGGWEDLLTNTNFPGVIVLGAAAIPSLFLVVRWLLRVQKDFVDFYVKENEKLRVRVDTLEQENRDKDDIIVELKTTVGALENKVAAHERTIDHLNEIIERRKNPR